MTKFNIIAFSNSNVRHLPCSATLTTNIPVGFENRNDIVKGQLVWNNPISLNQIKANVVGKVSACNNGKNLTFICEDLEYITDVTKS